MSTTNPVSTANAESQVTHGRLMRLATYASVAVAIGLVAIKLLAWLITDSVAMLSSFMDSALDLAASLINLYAVRQALQPADAEHRFGHGKAEPLAGLVQSAFVVGSAVLLVAESAPRLFHPIQPHEETFGLMVMAFAMVATLALVIFQHYVIRRTKSVAIAADFSHYTADLALNGAVVVALMLGQWVKIPWIDPLFAIAIAGFLTHGAWRIAIRSLDLLMDREFPDDDRKTIIATAHVHPSVRAVHDLRTRSSGLQHFIQMRLELDHDLSLLTAHAIAEAVEADILAAFPRAEIIIHQDPSGSHPDHHGEKALADGLIP